MAGHADFDATRRPSGRTAKRRGETSEDRGLTAALTALVLCGGQSRRMGTDKAMLRVHGDTLLAHAVSTVSQWTTDVRLACGRSARYESFGLPLCLDRWPDAGPLAGIEAGLSDARPGWCLVLACDMPRVAAGLFGCMLRRAIDSDVDVCWLESEGGIEPLCGVYHTRVVGAMRAALTAGERKVTSFVSYGMDSGLQTRCVRVAAFGARTARSVVGGARDTLAANLNTPEDVRALESECVAVPERLNLES